MRLTVSNPFHFIMRSEAVESDNTGITCIVTIHGTGFQQAPSEGIAGYADDLHTHLCRELNKDDVELLSDDPDHRPHQMVGSVPIYVESVWPPGSFCREDGLKRLGSWVADPRTGLTVSHERRDDPKQELVKGKARIAHIALVYSRLEGEGPRLGASLITATRAIANLRRYSRAGTLVKTLYLDLIQPSLKLLWARVRGRPLYDSSAAVPSLRVREDDQKHATGKGSAPRHPSGFLAILRQLENDVAAYIGDNGSRQRVRSFVLDALLRLALRDDVSAIILNTHSNGTLIGLDVLQELPPPAAKKIRAIITAGSPIRKYVDLFAWGEYLALEPELTPWVEQWWNFYDERDIVANRLLPWAGWKEETEPPPEQLIGLYQAANPGGEIIPILIKDKLVNNVKNSPGGGIPAHNYWDNTQEFIPQVAELVRNVVDNNDQTPEAHPEPM
jgi:hypothetical protein